jgi:CRISPR type III-associated protein (TIGR04423 family)
MKLNDKKEVIDYINNLESYRGYVQFSHREIDLEKDIFKNSSPKVANEDGFIYEACFSNNENSISIKQINDFWFIDKTDITNIDKVDINNFQAIGDLKIDFAQIWEDKEDELCENMEVTKLLKVVFLGFTGDKND